MVRLLKEELCSILRVFNKSTFGTHIELTQRKNDLLDGLGFPKRGGRTNYNKVISFVRKIHDSFEQ
jgi:hypothetical protein